MTASWPTSCLVDHVQIRVQALRRLLFLYLNVLRRTESGIGTFENDSGSGRSLSLAPYFATDNEAAYTLRNSKRDVRVGPS